MISSKMMGLNIDARSRFKYVIKKFAKRARTHQQRRAVIANFSIPFYATIFQVRAMETRQHKILFIDYRLPLRPEKSYYGEAAKLYLTGHATGRVKEYNTWSQKRTTHFHEFTHFLLVIHLRHNISPASYQFIFRVSTLGKVLHFILCYIYHQ